jgi:hypothetical protein
MLIVEATKRSVGDLQKTDLEGKRVLVGPDTHANILKAAKAQFHIHEFAYTA